MATISALPAQYRQAAARMPEALLKSITAVEATARVIDHERLMAAGCSAGLSPLAAQGFFQLAASVLTGDQRPGAEATTHADKAVQADLVKTSSGGAVRGDGRTYQVSPGTWRRAASGEEPLLYKRSGGPA